jgi:hypothetical protein
MEPRSGQSRLIGMKRLMIAGAVALLAVAGCGTAHAHGNASAGTGSKSGKLAVANLPKGYLPALTTQQVEAGHLVSRPWTLVGMSHNGTVAQIKYSYGGCTPRPKGVLVTRSGPNVTLSLEAPRLKPGTICAPNLVVGTASVMLPGIAGHTLQHAAAKP